MIPLISFLNMTRPRFDRHELAGAFGDIGTDLPLIAALIGATDLNGATVLIVFGALQILTGLVYGLPMPMQPLKAMAATMISANTRTSIWRCAPYASAVPTPIGISVMTSDAGRVATVHACITP